MPSVEPSNPADSLIAQVLTPGSSRLPLWVWALDISFAFLLFVFLGLLWITDGNKHVWALIGIESCLWASVKWFVYELERTPLPEEGKNIKKESKKDL